MNKILIQEKELVRFEGKFITTFLVYENINGTYVCRGRHETPSTNKKIATDDKCIASYYEKLSIRATLSDIENFPF